MVIRILVCLAFLITSLCTPLAAQSFGPGYPALGPQYCPPPPPMCGPQKFNQPRVARLCGGLLGGCANVCGAILGIPAAVMGCLLAPPVPPKFSPSCRPPMPCYRPYVPVPCAPAKRITKCAPARYGHSRPMHYHPAGGYSAVPPTVAPRLPGPMPAPLSSIEGTFPMAVKLATLPLNAVTGALSAPFRSSGALAFKPAKDRSDSQFGEYW